MEKCKKCGSTNIILMQYMMTTEDYDGISEIKCNDCGARIGRWTGKELKEGELEPRYGIN
jgi:DNA-directed RNA polymerase subunit RPC12/RpoP